jgi:hypothetical protein
MEKIVFCGLFFAKRERQKMTGRKGQSEREDGAGQAEKDIHNRTGRTGQDIYT